MTAVIAIDPGTTRSALVRYDGDAIEPLGILPNQDVLRMLRGSDWSRTTTTLAIEMIASYGMPVGREVFETCLWIGRFLEAWLGPHILVYRQEVKLHLCGTPRAKDPNIRQALLDRFGSQGTRRAPGRTYGLKGDLWSALAVAVNWADRRAS